MGGIVQNPHWPFLIDVYFFLGGLAAGAFVVATAARLLGGDRYRAVSTAGYWLALVAVIPSPIILVVDLGRPERFLNMLQVFNTSSPMSMGSWALTGFGICAGLAALLSLSRSGGGVLASVIGVVGSALGFFVAAYPGVLLGATARPLWTHGHLLGAMFLAVGAATGAAAIGLVLAITRSSREGLGPVNLFTGIALVVQLVSLGLFAYTVRASSSAAAIGALDLLTSGRLSTLFWWGAVAAGSAVPLVLALLGARRASGGLTAVAAILTLVGGFLIKYVVMAAGQA